jgi:hypothetical protein
MPVAPGVQGVAGACCMSCGRWGLGWRFGIGGGLVAGTGAPTGLRGCSWRCAIASDMLPSISQCGKTTRQFDWGVLEEPAMISGDWLTLLRMDSSLLLRSLLFSGSSYSRSAACGVPRSCRSQGEGECLSYHRLSLLLFLPSEEQWQWARCVLLQRGVLFSTWLSGSWYKTDF